MRTAVIVLCGMVLGTPLLAAGALSAPDSSASGGGVADIPPDYLRDYRIAAQRLGLDWAVLAAIGKLECDHGRLDAAGCNPRDSVNKAGAAGPMQFLATTWRRGARAGSSPPPGPATQATSDGYASDGDGDGVADIWDAADAITAAARYLAANGAPDHYRRALFAYNHADWYVVRVLQQADAYRTAASTTGAAGVPVTGEEDPVDYAARYLGSPYVYGGNHVDLEVELDPASAPVLQVSARDGRVGFFDCSSLASWAFAKTFGVFTNDHPDAHGDRSACQPKTCRARLIRRLHRRRQ